MRIEVALDDRGMIADTYAKHADAAHQYAGTPTTSFPFTVHDIPKEAQSLALAFFDFDSIPVCGFAWIHWVAAGIDASLARGGSLAFPEDASNRRAFSMVQGRTSAVPPRARGTVDPLLACRYNGPQPPDKTHVYTLRVYALDRSPRLGEGFWANELVWAMQDHIVAQAEANLPARA